VRIPVHALMCIIGTDLEAGNDPGNGMHLYCLTGFHAIDHVIVFSLICNKNLACNKGTRLDCCDMISATGDFGMSIITLGRL
jgi:hypothetical protein